MVSVRAERLHEAKAVRRVNEAAFEQQLEADLVDDLRSACPDALSLVAELDDAVVGHILFTPAVLETASEVVEGMGLAPMAVLPELQRRGIGSRMIEEGLRRLRAAGCPFVVVLGHPDYYPRFGFVPAGSRGIRCQWEDVPDEAFMILVLDEERLRGASGVARYRPEFDAAV